MHQGRGFLVIGSECGTSPQEVGASGDGEDQSVQDRGQGKGVQLPSNEECIYVI